MRRGYLLIITLLISSLACGFISTATPVPTPNNLPTQGISTKVPTDTPGVEPVSSQTPSAEVTTTPTQEKPTKTPYPTSVLDAQLTNEINLIQSQVIEERGLQPKHPVPFVLLSTDQLRQNVISDYNANHTDKEISDELLQYSILGLVDPGLDLHTLEIDLQSEQIAGYYDTETAEMFVVQGEGFQGPERLTFSHEYTHVLQDQNYDIEHGLKMNDATCEADSEYCAAVQALIEGDATVSEFVWLYYYATTQDKDQVDAFNNSLKTPIFDSAPAFMRDDLLFPYSQGSTFVMEFINNGGWSAVDALYHNPPVSTEQILHPSLYPSDTPVKVDLPDLTTPLGAGWREVAHNQMGEWYTYLILARGINENARLDDTTAQAAAAGWGGDEYMVLHNDEMNASAFVMKTIWDTTKDASEFASGLEKYANTRFEVTATQQGDTLTWSYSDGYSSLYLSGDTTIWMITPDSTTAQTITGLVLP